ncbi:hypothetical protein N7517_003675 [Penicillium concentricum]|uniref:Uncharacterized protein n=1 Tax=Penicillium concentricum TaxID=293559 RepID=A0A9W9S649_9EURO|nr:uncharacterized protein N7517_003675 [Penicillium concentricum]KAJ5371669.1 hypothetical protein N7517_003675 [Penicillium concentricum]
MAPKRSFDEMFNTNECQTDLTKNLLDTTILLPTLLQLSPSTKASKRTFEEMFSFGACEIDFTENLPDTTAFLAIPEPMDKLVATYKKIDKLAELVREGKSLAIHTNYAKAQQKECDAITEAKSKMLPLEIEQFNAWFSGAAMPNIDWEQNQKVIRLSEDEEAHFNQQVRAIREIYHDPNITRENAYWFVSNFGYMLPLIEAVAIVRVIQRKYLHEREGITEMEFAELQTARSIIKITMDTLQKRQRRVELDDTLREKQPGLEMVTVFTSEACGTIQFRANVIHKKAMEYKEGLECRGFSRAKE